MKIDLTVQEIRSGHESLMDGLTDAGHSYNPLPLHGGEKTTKNKTKTKQPLIWKLTRLFIKNISSTITQKVYTVKYGHVDSFDTLMI